jgi:large subunit ribosomal protein L9
MDVILLKDMDNLGEKHTVVSVKDGYGRNYLIPQGMALIANKTNMGKLDELKAREAAERKAQLEKFQAIADQIKGKTLKVGAKAGTSGKIFGSVTNIQLAQALKDQLDLDVDRKIIRLDEEVKMLGTYTAILDFDPELDIKMDFEVVAD